MVLTSVGWKVTLNCLSSFHYPRTIKILKYMSLFMFSIFHFQMTSDSFLLKLKAGWAFTEWQWKISSRSQSRTRSTKWWKFLSTNWQKLSNDFKVKLPIVINHHRFLNRWESPSKTLRQSWQALTRVSILRRNYSYLSLSSWRIVFSFLFPFLIFKILRQKFSCSSRLLRF